MPHERVKYCRLCGWGDLPTVLDLGEMAFTGVFKSEGEAVPKGPLEIVECAACRLTQLAHAFPLDVIYGGNYGYRSGLNRTMVDHLRDVSVTAWRFAKP